MKAMILEDLASIDASPLKLVEWPDPQPQPGQIRVKVRACGICRTDLHVIEGDLARYRLPIIPGHQVVGVVDALGKGATRFKRGQRVGIAWLRHTCGTCAFCALERENLCSEARFTGYHAHGGYAEYALAPEAFAYEIPEVFDDVTAAPLLCAGIIGYRALKRANVPDGGTLALYGFGSSAHVVFQIARHRRCRLFVITRGENHRQLARDMGADWVGGDASGLPEKADSAIIFAPAGELVPPALASLKKGGTLALAGIHMTDIPSLNYKKHLFYERNICSVTSNTRGDGEQLLAEAAQVPVRPHMVVYPWTQANRALQDLKHDRINGSGVLRVAAD